MTSGQFAPHGNSRTYYTMTFNNEAQPAARVSINTKWIKAFRAVTPEELGAIQALTDAAAADRLGRCRRSPR